MSITVEREFNNEGEGKSCGVVELWKTYANPPSFDAFRGRQWESAYPRVLESFYWSIGAAYGGGSRNFYGTESFKAGDDFHRSASYVGDAASCGKCSFGGRCYCADWSVGDNMYTCICTQRTENRSDACSGSSEADVTSRVVDVAEEKRKMNRERNKKRRQRRAEEKKMQAEKLEERKNFFEKKKEFSIKGDWRSKDGGDMIKQDQSPGTFWNSTSSQVRQELIDSKARMHIAENKRREREALDKIAYLESPEAAMHKAIGMIDYAQKQAKKENDNKVYGWAKTVATSSAESLARSTPDSVPSFDEVSAQIEASSQSSLELELKAKQDELDDERRKIALLENEIRDERRAKEEVVAKSKYDAVVDRMRQLETQTSENNKNTERVNFRRNRVEEKRNALGETEKQMRARMAKLSPEEHQREVVRLMRERAWENS